MTGGHSYNEYLWEPTPATVACRELNPGKIVTSKHNYEQHVIVREMHESEGLTYFCVSV